MHTNFSYKQTDRTKTTCFPQRGGGGGRHTNFSYKQTDRKKTTCLPQRGGGIQTLVTNRQTGQKQHAFLKGGEAYKL